jgi:hypothetical protein
MLLYTEESAFSSSREFIVCVSPIWDILSSFMFSFWGSLHVS